MQLSTRKLVSLLTFLVLSLSAGQARAAAPTITTLSPTSGAIGASVTITGTNFSTTPTSNTVTFNGTAATVTSATATTHSLLPWMESPRSRKSRYRPPE